MTFEDKRVHIFLKVICPNAWLEFELTNYDVAI